MLPGTASRRVVWLSILALYVTVVLCTTGLADWSATSHIGTNQRVLVICVKWNESASTRMSPTDWVNLLNNETTHFYDQATYGMTTFLFETATSSSPDGWFNLGYSSADYDFFKTGQDAINLVDPHVDFGRYDRVLVITNSPSFGGQGGGPWWWAVNEGIEATFVEDGSNVGKRLMTMAIVNEWLAHSYGNTFDEAGSVAAHELGHQLGVSTHYGDIRWHADMSVDVITPWDIMGLSPTLNHFLGWPKANRGWIPAGSRIQVVGPPVGSNIDTTITLCPQETYTTSPQIIVIPFTNTPLGVGFSGYLVENRKRLNGDENLPSEGVLLTLVNQGPDIVLPCAVLQDPGSPGDMNQAPLEVGDSYHDDTRNLTITVVSQSGNNYNVRIQYPLPPSAKPDPMIIPWGAPPWESVDIWVDSEKNGWGTYRYTDSAGNPTGNGDDAWVDRNNRVYVRIRNIGPGTATNVRVQVVSNEPPGMGDSGSSWAYRGTIVFPSLAAGATAQDYVNWTPTVDQHTCIKAAIEERPDVELSTANNIAQENVSHFDTTPSSPYRPVTLKARVNNPFEAEQTVVHFNVRNIPRGWAVRVDPPHMTLPPNGHDWVALTVFPSGAPGARLSPASREELQRYRPGYIGKPTLEAYVPYADTFIPIGGIDAWTHLVNKTGLTLQLIYRGIPYKPGNVVPGTVAPGTIVPPGGAPGTAAPGGTARGTVTPRTLSVGLRLPGTPGGRAATAPTLLARIAQPLEKRSLILKPLPVPQFRRDETTTLRGTITPGFAGATIAIELTSEGRREVRFATTDALGKYELRLSQLSAGTWQTQAFYAGGTTQAPAESDFVRFVVR